MKDPESFYRSVSEPLVVFDEIHQLPNPSLNEGFYTEWLDSYFARDVQELFQVEKRAGFLKLLELILRQSGGLMEATTLARALLFLD